MKNSQETIVGKCNVLFESTTGDFKNATKAANRMIGKNLLLNFVTSLVLLAAAIGGYIYFQNYRDGSKIAEEKAVEALAEERTKLENELALKRKQIEQEAIASYKNSNSYVEDACKLVASNISKPSYLHLMYIYIRSDDIKCYPQVRSFYNDFLKKGHEQFIKNMREK